MSRMAAVRRGATETWVLDMECSCCRIRCPVLMFLACALTCGWVADWGSSMLSFLFCYQVLPSSCCTLEGSFAGGESSAVSWCRTAVTKSLPAPRALVGRLEGSAWRAGALVTAGGKQRPYASPGVQPAWCSRSMYVVVVE